MSCKLLQAFENNINGRQVEIKGKHSEKPMTQNLIQDFKILFHLVLFTEYTSCIKHSTENLTEHHGTLKQNTYHVLKDKYDT